MNIIDEKDAWTDDADYWSGRVQDALLPIIEEAKEKKLSLRDLELLIIYTTNYLIMRRIW